MKQDYLQVCNDRHVNEQDFALQFCNRCISSECSRSQDGRSRFDQRVQNWEDRLFLNVTKLDPSDPRYVEINARKFTSIQPASSDWSDPRSLERGPSAKVSVSVPEQISPVRPVQGNTPNRPGQIIGNSLPKEHETVYDPWATKKPLAPGETLVKPGAKIKLGDSQ